MHKTVSEINLSEDEKEVKREIGWNSYRSLSEDEKKKKIFLEIGKTG